MSVAAKEMRELLMQSFGGINEKLQSVRSYIEFSFSAPRARTPPGPFARVFRFERQ
jgi:hypothetical protein